VTSGRLWGDYLGGLLLSSEHCLGVEFPPDHIKVHLGNENEQGFCGEDLCCEVVIVFRGTHCVFRIKSGWDNEI
jgi:hypothetical protein